MDKIRIYIALLFCQAISFILPVQAQDNTGNNSNRYNTLYSYDCMGNITSLSRNGLLDNGSYDYYPYGGLMANSTNHNQQRYKYNGKELDRMHGLDWYDYGARWMNAAINYIENNDYNEKLPENIKNIIEVNPPEGTSNDAFEKKVIDVASQKEKKQSTNS